MMTNELRCIKLQVCGAGEMAYERSLESRAFTVGFVLYFSPDAGFFPDARE
jgi:hypothetical protein